METKQEKRRRQVREATARYRKTEKGIRYRKEVEKKSDAFKKSRLRYTKRWRERNQIKTTAHNFVKYALKTGRLAKGICDVCGSKRTVAHHDDYFQPLKVKWLCYKHHNELHCMPANKKKTR